MLLEQEIASVIRFVLDAAGNPNPYYYSVPESFETPAVYFPSPEITTGGETFLTYRMEFAWYITFHGKTSEDAYALAHAALSAIMDHRCVVPLIAEDGSFTGHGLRINSASIKPADTGVYQLALTFVSRRPYANDLAQKVMNYKVIGWSNPDIYQTHLISSTVESAVENYLQHYPTPEKAGDQL